MNEKEKDDKAFKTLMRLVLTDDSKMTENLVKWYLGKIKEIYSF